MRDGRERVEQHLDDAMFMIRKALLVIEMYNVQIPGETLHKLATASNYIEDVAHASKSVPR